MAIRAYSSRRARRGTSRIVSQPDGLPAERLPVLARAWLEDGAARQLSPLTLRGRRFILDKLSRFLTERQLHACDTHALRSFLAFLGGNPDGARWDSPDPRCERQLRPKTLKTYYTDLRTFFRWLVAQGELDESPLARVQPPPCREEPLAPFSPEEVQALLAAATKTRTPERDTALLLLLYDTGLRAGELCGILMRDLDLTARRVTVLGKGNKHRTLPFNPHTARALYRYLSLMPREPDEPLFIGEGGRTPGCALMTSGLLRVFKRLTAAAGIHRPHCGPHAMRHAFAVQFLRNGGNQATLQMLMGHTHPQMTMRYVQFAQADLDAEHRDHSPVAALLGRKGRR